MPSTVCNVSCLFVCGVGGLGGDSLKIFEEQKVRSSCNVGIRMAGTFLALRDTSAGTKHLSSVIFSGSVP